MKFVCPFKSNETLTPLLGFSSLSFPSLFFIFIRYSLNFIFDTCWMLISHFLPSFQIIYKLFSIIA